ncbi:MAG: mechanosensitive ion channel, partial [Gammaproteobacteria bacterium]|nr:mechanosensitive ion channel [Gammaproteobacteria bacterium]
VRSVIRSVVEADPRVLKEPECLIAVAQLADSSVNFTVRPWVNTADYWSVYFDLTEAVKKRFDKEGISIPFPQRDVHVYQK